MPTRADDIWARPARGALEALHALGYDAPDCLPDGDEPCGGSFAQHYMASLATLKALADHELDAHIGPLSQLAPTIYARALHTFDTDPRCQHNQGGRHGNGEGYR